MRKLVLPAALALLAGLMALVSHPAQAGTLWVNDDETTPLPPGTSCSNAGFNTIQSAVNHAAGIAGIDTIRVCAGTYIENVSIGIGNSVRIIGDGAANTIVHPVPATAGPIFDVTSAGNVTIEKLTVDGKSAQIADADGFVRGIRYDSTNGVIRKVAVLNIRDASGSAQGLGIRIQSDLGPANVRIEHNLVQNFTRGGISANRTDGIGPSTHAHVRNNTVIGPEEPKVWAPNGIQISRGATALVTGNSVRDATSPAPDAGAGSGILLFCAGPTTAEGNSVLTSDLGIALGDNQDGRVRGNVVRDSVFDAYSLQFIGTFFGDVLGCPMFPSPTQNNVLRQNLGVNSAEYGISLASFDPANPPLPPPTMNDLLGNVIRQSDIDGIHVFQGRDNRFIGNSIAISGDHDCDDDTMGTGTAGTANTWEDNEGTTSEPEGLCTGRNGGDDGDDDDFDDDGKENRDDDDDDNDAVNDDADNDDDNDGIADDDDIDDDNDGIPDVIDDLETFTADGLLGLTLQTASQPVRVAPH